MKSKGLGDDIAKITSATRLDKLAEKISEIITGDTDCGCGKTTRKIEQISISIT
jgi:hypothetical protein